jgi:hypothetical protein
MADQIVYWQWGTEEKPLNPPNQNTCKQCAAVQSRANLAKFDTERDAQIAFAWGGLKMVNDSIDALWTPLWNAYQCVNIKDCKVRVACGNAPSFIEVVVTDVTVADATAPAGVKQMWQLTVIVQRKIKCMPPEDGKKEEDVPVQPFKDKLPPSEKPKGADGHPQESPQNPGDGTAAKDLSGKVEN